MIAHLKCNGEKSEDMNEIIISRASKTYLERSFQNPGQDAIWKLGREILEVLKCQH